MKFSLKKRTIVDTASFLALITKLQLTSSNWLGVTNTWVGFSSFSGIKIFFFYEGKTSTT